MKKIPLKKKRTKFDAFVFTKALLQEPEDYKRKPPYEPPNKQELKEMAIQSNIIDYLLFEQANGHLFVQRINNTPIYDPTTGTHRSMPKGAHKGFPDIFVLKDGRCVFFEVKSSSGRQSNDQVKVQHWLEQQGAEYYIVRSTEYVKKALQTKPE